MTASAGTRRYVFGPVASRRLGQSLGIDPIPAKTCNWNCVYCQLGRSRPMVAKRAVYAPVAEVLAEAASALEHAADGGVDFVTFAGSGEPTLHSEIGALVAGVKALDRAPVAVITNGSLLHLPEVRRDLLAADAVLPTLDAGNEAIYRAVDRPHPEATFARLVGGLREFRSEYSGKLWIEVMLVAGLNDAVDALEDLADILLSICPDEVHITLPTRPPAESSVRAPDEATLARAAAILGRSARVIRPATVRYRLRDDEERIAQIVAIIGRHPLRESELVDALGATDGDEIAATLEALKATNQVQCIERNGERHFVASHAFHAVERATDER